MANPTTALRLKANNATKVGQYSTGQITYEVLADESRDSIWIRIVGNDSSGWFSRELLTIEKIEACLEGIKDGEVMLSKRFAAAFKSRSANNAGFLAAALRAEGLLLPAPEQPNRHILGEDRETWKTNLLDLPGELIDLAPAEKTVSQASTTDTSEGAGAATEDETEGDQPAAEVTEAPATEHIKAKKGQRKGLWGGLAMLRIRTPVEVSGLQNDVIRQHVERRINEIQPDAAQWTNDFGEFFIVEPGDSMQSLEDEAAWPLFQRHHTDSSPTFEWVEAHAGLYEIAYILSDSGQFVVVVIPADDRIDEALLTFCQQHATPPFSSPLQP